MTDTGRWRLIFSWDTGWIQGVNELYMWSRGAPWSESGLSQAAAKQKQRRFLQPEMSRKPFPRERGVLVIDEQSSPARNRFGKTTKWLTRVLQARSSRRRSTPRTKGHGQRAASCKLSMCYFHINSAATFWEPPFVMRQHLQTVG